MWLPCTRLIIFLLGIIQEMGRARQDVHHQNLWHASFDFIIDRHLRLAFQLVAHRKSAQNTAAMRSRLSDLRKFVCILICNANCWQTFQPFGVHLRIILWTSKEKNRRKNSLHTKDNRRNWLFWFEYIYARTSAHASSAQKHSNNALLCSVHITLTWQIASRRSTRCDPFVINFGNHLDWPHLNRDIDFFLDPHNT